MGIVCGRDWYSQNHAAFLKAFNEHSSLLTTIQLAPLETKRIFNVFVQFDRSGGGTVTVNEFIEKLGFENEMFVRRAFAMFDTDGSGELSFGEFVSAIWNFLTFSRNSLILFAFDMFDTDHSQQLGFQEVRDMLGVTLGDKYYNDESTTAALRALCGRPDARRPMYVTRKQFQIFALDNPRILAPVLELQTELRIQVVGVPFWEGLSARRIGLEGLATTKEFLSKITEDQEYKATVYGVDADPRSLEEKRAGTLAKHRELHHLHEEEKRDQEWNSAVANAAAADEEGATVLQVAAAASRKHPVFPPTPKAGDGEAKESTARAKKKVKAKKKKAKKKKAKEKKAKKERIGGKRIRRVAPAPEPAAAGEQANA